MSNPENPNQPLLAASTQPAVLNAQGGRSARAYKVAGLTLLACVLIVGQAMITYFLISQRNDIKSLKDQSNDLNSVLTKERSAARPMRMHIPMNALPKLIDVSGDEESTEEKAVPQQATECQLEAAGVKPVQLPDFRPQCDERGLYQAQQCFLKTCWCVNPATGLEIPGSLSNGQASCGAPVFTGRSKMMRVPDVIA